MYRRRRIVAGSCVLASVVLLVVGISAVFGSTSEGESVATAPTQQPVKPPELPRGGRKLFPDYRVVAYYGSPPNGQLGILGHGTPAESAKRLAKQAVAYKRKTRPVMPAMELIAILSTASPGPDGKYRQHLADKQIKRYLAAARKAKALLILDVQPGRADFLEESTKLEKWLKEPDVGLALDPEWRMGPNELPGKVIGSVDAREVNAVSTWLQRLTKKHNLPEKLFIIHQFTDTMIRNEHLLRVRPNLATVMNVDGFGGRAAKLSKYHDFMHRAPQGSNQGLKLFYKRDPDILRPREVLELEPPPDLIIYE